MIKTRQDNDVTDSIGLVDAEKQNWATVIDRTRYSLWWKSDRTTTWLIL